MCVYPRCVCARECVQKAHRILPPQLPQVFSRGFRDLTIALVLSSLCRVQGSARSALQFTPQAPAQAGSPHFPRNRPSRALPLGFHPGARLRRAGQLERCQRAPGTRTPESGCRCENLLERRKSSLRTRLPLQRLSYPGPRAQEATMWLPAGARSPGRPVPRSLTSTTEPLTASDTLCRSSAAVPGLLSRLVNLRTSAMAEAAGKSRRAYSLPRAGAAGAAVAPCVYTPAGHLSARWRRGSRSSSLPPAAPPWFPPSLLFSLARLFHRPAPQRRQLPPFESLCFARQQPEKEGVSGGEGRVEGEGVLEVGARVTREERGSGNHSGSACSCCCWCSRIREAR